MIQRGGADGLATIAPTGDPAYAGLRGDLAANLLDRPKSLAACSHCTPRWRKSPRTKVPSRRCSCILGLHLTATACTSMR